MAYGGATGLNNQNRHKEKLMDENKRKKIEAKLFQLFSQTDPKETTGALTKSTPTVVKVIRRRKGKPDLQVA